MKKVLIGLTSVTFLAACGMNEVEPEQSETNSAAGSNNEAVEENNTENDELINADSTENTEENETAAEAENNGENEETSADAEEVYEFDLQIEFHNDEEWEFDYESDDLNDAEVERDGEEKMKGEEAAAEIEAVLSEINITSSRTLREMKEEVLTVLDLSPEDVEDFDMEIEYVSGETITIDHESAREGEAAAVRELDMDIDFFSGDDLEYDYEADDSDAEIERQDGTEVEGSEAKEEIEAFLAEVSITMDRSIDEMKSEALSALSIEESEVKDFDIDVEYDNGETVKFKHDAE